MLRKLRVPKRVRVIKKKIFFLVVLRILRVQQKVRVIKLCYVNCVSVQKMVSCVT